MYQCKDCGGKFQNPKIYIEKHGLTLPPYEKIYLCPFCDSASFKEIITKYCNCCGARLKEQQGKFCSEKCKITAEKLRLQEYKRLKKLNDSPLVQMVKEVTDYNKVNNTKYSYGQYVAIIKPRLKDKKWTKRENI